MPRKRPVVSSSAAQIYKDLKPRVQFGGAKIDDEIHKLKLDEPTALAVRELFDKDERPRILVELANIKDDGYWHFVKAFSVGTSPFEFFKRNRFYAVLPDDLFRFRNGLRALWHSNPVSLTEHQELISWLKFLPSIHELRGVASDLFVGKHAEMVAALLETDPKPLYYAPIFPSLDLSRFVIDPKHLPAQLVQGVLEHRENMKQCANPDCINPYFLAKRRTQKFCESGPCVDYGHRQNALDYWHRHKQNNVSQPKGKSTKKGITSGKNKTHRQ
jgi:hypothetical protein